MMQSLKIAIKSAYYAGAFGLSMEKKLKIDKVLNFIDIMISATISSRIYSKSASVESNFCTQYLSLE